MKSYQVSWTEYEEDLFRLASQLNPKEFYGILAIPRGGLVLGTCLSHIFKKPIFYPHFLPKIERSNFLLVVDDCSDTGTTLLGLKKLLDKKRIAFKVATLYRKDHTQFEPHFYSRTLNVWINFPWEKNFFNSRKKVV